MQYPQHQTMSFHYGPHRPPSAREKLTADTYALSDESNSACLQDVPSLEIPRLGNSCLTLACLGTQCLPIVTHWKEEKLGPAEFSRYPSRERLDHQGPAVRIKTCSHPNWLQRRETNPRQHCSPDQKRIYGNQVKHYSHRHTRPESSC